MYSENDLPNGLQVQKDILRWISLDKPYFREPEAEILFNKRFANKRLANTEIDLTELIEIHLTDLIDIGIDRDRDIDKYVRIEKEFKQAVNTLLTHLKTRANLVELLSEKYGCDPKGHKVVKAVPRAINKLSESNLIGVTKVKARSEIEASPGIKASPEIKTTSMSYYVFNKKEVFTTQINNPRSLYYSSIDELIDLKDKLDKLTDRQVAQRFIDMPSLFGLVPNDEVKAKVAIIKSCLENKSQIEIDGNIVNPVGVINDGVYFTFVVKNSDNLTVIYDLVDIREITKLDLKLFHARCHEEALEILKRSTKDKRVRGLPENEHIKLILRKEANDAFRGAKLEHAKGWKYKKIDQWTGKVSFNHDISINLLNFLAQFGSAIEIEEPQELKQALDIHLNTDNPYERPDALKNLFKHKVNEYKKQNVKIRENTKAIQDEEIIYHRQLKLIDIEYRLEHEKLKPKVRNTMKKKRSKLRMKL